MADANRPAPGEAAEYYFRYIDLVPDGDICATLNRQLPETLALLAGVPPDRIAYRYAPGKWTLRELLSHLNDTERLFAVRAFWFARGFDSPLPSFDEAVAAKHAAAEARSWSSHVNEFESIRASTLHLFRHLPPHAWLRRGIASDMPFTVRALAYVIAGHLAHHTAVVRERYLE